MLLGYSHADPLHRGNLPKAKLLGWQPRPESGLTNFKSFHPITQSLRNCQRLKLLQVASKMQLPKQKPTKNQLDSYQCAEVSMQEASSPLCHTAPLWSDVSMAQALWGAGGKEFTGRASLFSHVVEGTERDTASSMCIVIQLVK